MRHLPNYLLCKRPGRYYFRMVVPKALRPHFKSRELKKTLNACNLSEAACMAQALASQVQRAFKECEDVARKKQPPLIHYFHYTFTDASGTHEIRVERDDADDEAKVVAAAIANLPLGRGIGASRHPPNASISLSVVIQKFCEEHRRTAVWGEKTDSDYSAILRSLVELVGGDLPIHTLDSAVARDVKEILQKLPPNVSKHPLYRGKPLRDVVAMNLNLPP